jgi:hypothetical protein
MRKEVSWSLTSWYIGRDVDAVLYPVLVQWTPSYQYSKVHYRSAGLIIAIGVHIVHS